MDVIESYEVNGAQVYITRDGRYQVSEPVLNRDAESVWEGLMDNLYYSYSDPGDADVVPGTIWKRRCSKQTFGFPHRIHLTVCCR